MRLITAKHRGTNADNIQGDERRPETHGVASVALVGMRVSFLDASAAHRNDSEKKKTAVPRNAGCSPNFRRAGVLPHNAPAPEPETGGGERTTPCLL
jgi:hypothetical protein